MIKLLNKNKYIIIIYITFHSKNPLDYYFMGALSMPPLLTTEFINSTALSTFVVQFSMIKKI